LPTGAISNVRPDGLGRVAKSWRPLRFAGRDTFPRAGLLPAARRGLNKSFPLNVPLFRGALAGAASPFLFPPNSSILPVRPLSVNDLCPVTLFSSSTPSSQRDHLAEARPRRCAFVPESLPFRPPLRRILHRGAERTPVNMDAGRNWRAGRAFFPCSLVFALLQYRLAAPRRRLLVTVARGTEQQTSAATQEVLNFFLPGPLSY